MDTTLEELEGMLPAKLTGIPGCTEYNKRRDDALRKVAARHSMASRAIGRLNPDDLRAVLVAEVPFTDAFYVFKRECRKLESERKRLMCEPDTAAKAQEEIVWDTRSLLVNTGRPGAAAFNGRVAAFADRRMKALKGLQALATNASEAFYLDSIEHDGKADDRLLRAKNRADVALATEARPFNAEYRELLAERTRCFGK